MDDERIERALRLGPPDEPTYAPRGDWRAGADGDKPEGVSDAGSATPAPRVERGASAPGVEPVRPIGVHVRDARRPGRRSFPVTIAASVAVLLGFLFAVQLLPAGPAATPVPSPDLLGRVMASGTLTVAVSNGAPQTGSEGGSYIGFDVDVAKAIASELALRADVTPMSPDAFTSATWDLALPGHRAGLLADVQASEPYGYWPAWLAVANGSTVTDVASLASGRVCAVAGSAGADWLAGGADGATTTAPSGTETILLSSDDECIAAVADGRADALVTATLLDEEVQAHGLRLVVPTRVILDPWTVVVRGPSPDTASLMTAIDGAIAALRDSGRLADLSRSSFGGFDVTVSSP